MIILLELVLIVNFFETNFEKIDSINNLASISKYDTTM